MAHAMVGKGCKMIAYRAAASREESSRGGKGKALMVDRNRRKQLASDYKQTRREAGIYRITNRENGKSLVASSTNLDSVRSKMEFARTTNSPGVLGYQLKSDVLKFGIEAFALEILEVLEVQPEMTDVQIRADLRTLEQLWREKYDQDQLY